MLSKMNTPMDTGVIAILAAILEAGDRAAVVTEEGRTVQAGPGSQIWYYTDRALDLLIAADSSIERRKATEAGFAAQAFRHRPQTADERNESVLRSRAVDAGVELEFTGPARGPE